MNAKAVRDRRFWPIALALALGAREKNEVAVGIAHDEVERAPGMPGEGLLEVDSSTRKCSKERSDRLFARDGNAGGKQLLAIADVADEYRLADTAQTPPRAITHDQGVEGRVTVSEADGEAELADVEAARRGDIGDEKLRLGGREDGRSGLCIGAVCHRADPIAAVPSANGHHLNNPTGRKIE